ncbi:hypothetical protein PEDI_00600 [Persicobacter diffluens]|uniref:Uncharacterized protein n=1 Tax=Persicobacter diffluens TaxID=981 RepID=A0AAN4VV50_9BACT|nr:hypothetical protein PEDI_00600 [Persicobacter diffluens]
MNSPLFSLKRFITFGYGCQKEQHPKFEPTLEISLLPFCTIFSYSLHFFGCSTSKNTESAHKSLLLS